MTFDDLNKIPETLAALEWRIAALEKRNADRSPGRPVTMTELQNALETFQSNMLHVVGDQLVNAIVKRQ